MLSRSLYGALLTFVRSLSVYGVKVTGVFYDFSIESSCEVFMHISYYNVFYLRFSRENGGGGGLDLVYGSSSSSYMDCEVKFVYECVRLTQCSCVDAFVVDLIIHGCSFYGSTTFRMSTRRLPVLLFVSSAHYILLFVARCAYGGRGGKLFNCAQWRVNILRRFHRLLLIILLPAPP